MAAPSASVDLLGYVVGQVLHVDLPAAAGRRAGGGDVAAEADQHAGAEAVVRPAGRSGRRRRLGGGAEVELRCPAGIVGVALEASGCASRRGGVRPRRRAPGCAPAAHQPRCRGRSRARPAPSRASGRRRRRWSRAASSAVGHEVGSAAGSSWALAVRVADQRHQLAVVAEPAARVLDRRRARSSTRRGRLGERRGSVTTRRHGCSTAPSRGWRVAAVITSRSSWPGRCCRCRR